ncbi:twin-arginine translocase TatA/TatE family subunit [Candidatus Nitrospira neomarina]|uniref:Sec-independent protein translocase protein TatA n=1 Tax=Candidatus Nitrospira neomarina TaxID=3020899 RepID=A0AA96GDU7_9BACT|nr:twin-arginine translocase TatA/TatE family subunit [Candidatus Nitrospira neomarina]WNM60324.1 twin-arginine translocase TatA/TatE family subunit [Candidatus Nitrospira neomarina]
MFGSLGFTELILILMIVLIIFGAGKLPQLGEGVGKAIKGFKKSVQEAEAYDIDPQAQAENSASANQGNAQPQISQPMQTAPLETGSPMPPAAVQPAQQEQVPASSKA